MSVGATKIILLSLAAALLFAGCAAHERQSESTTAPGIDNTDGDWYGDSASKVIRLDQGWSAAESNSFWWTTQGSQLLPYAFFLALEQPNDRTLFRARRNMLKYRFLPERPSSANPDGLPIGLVADPDSNVPPGLIADRRSLGFTCAACHTTQINYKGTGMLIEGAPAMGDVATFLVELTAALQATANDNAKFDRFAAKVLGNDASAEKKASLRAVLRANAKQRSDYDKLNRSDVAEGFGRLDAFGRIFNTALTLVHPSNRLKANAPVRFPEIWDGTRQDFVQWTGVSPNTRLGPIMRNVGQLVGVSATIDPGNPPPSRGYASSVRLSNLRKLEDRLKTLQSPAWPENVLPPIKRDMAAAGRDVFVRNCRGCHHDVARSGHRIVTTRVPISKVRTDALAAENLIKARGKTGFLEGTRQFVYFGSRIGRVDTAYHITANTVVHLLLGKIAAGTTNKQSRRIAATTPDPDAILYHSKYEPQLQYKAPPLNGVWAAAPYLHNGSVPNIYEVISPPDKRSKTFSVGRREFDPVKVGFVSEPDEGPFLFDTAPKGNTNVGHPFGAHLTEAERWQVIEYLKTI
jgi:hypothetical protein